MKSAVVLALLLAVATAQSQFPFSEEPLQESVHSNKVFFNVTDISEVAGVWKGINSVFHAFVWESFLYDGQAQYNLTCEAAAQLGWDYDTLIRDPRTVTIEVDPERLEDGAVGRVVESHAGGGSSSAIVSYVNETLTMDDGTCRKWRPYFDWELGKTMLLNTGIFAYWPNEDGTIGFVTSKFSCAFTDVDHPLCTEGKFEVLGAERDGMYVDTVMVLECIAGPCLDLPGSLPGYVVTQGYIPAVPEEEAATDAGR